jgi:D-alanyl-D-alanine dipeptidase
MTDRAYADYPGGTAEQRGRRALLRQAMEAQEFAVIPTEWWHFDYKDWQQYPIQNAKFEDLGK